MNKIEAYWEKFLKESGQNKDDVGFSGEMVFESDSFAGNEKLSLVLSGRRTASFSLFESYQINKEPLPVSGELYIVEDSSSNPCCIIEITDVNVVPFGEITWPLARREGEDENLEVWQTRKQEDFEDESAILGVDFTKDTKILCEIFRVVYR